MAPPPASVVIARLVSNTLLLVWDSIEKLQLLQLLPDREITTATTNTTAINMASTAEVYTDLGAPQGLQRGLRAVKKLKEGELIARARLQVRSATDSGV